MLLNVMRLFYSGPWLGRSAAADGCGVSMTCGCMMTGLMENLNLQLMIPRMIGMVRHNNNKMPTLDATRMVPMTSGEVGVLVAMRKPPTTVRMAQAFQRLCRNMASA